MLEKQYYDSHIKRSLTGKYRPHGDLSKVDCVIAAGFGYREHNGKALPSATTQQIAAAIHQFEHLPKLLSHDLEVAYTRLFPHDKSLVHGIRHPDHLTTVRLVNEFRTIMRMNRFTNALLIGHQHHVAWLDYLCGQIAVPTTVPAGLQFAFDPASAQPWTRNEAAWQQEIRQRLDRGFDEEYREETYRLHH